MEVSNYLVSWLITYLWDLQPTFIGVIFHLLTSMDTLVYFFFRTKIQIFGHDNLSPDTSGFATSSDSLQGALALP